MASSLAGTAIRAAAYQLAPRLADLATNEELSVAAIRHAVDAGAQLIVLPELVTSGYSLDPDEARLSAIGRRHPVFARWAREAARGDAVVVGGFCEAGEDTHIYNSAAIVDASGILAFYRKLHLWDREKLVFEPGDEPPRVIETHVGRLGVLICYDAQFPEMTRALALDGAEVIAVPTNWSPAPRPDGERSAEVISAMVAARANGVFMICCDRTGSERGIDFAGDSTVINSSGWIVAAQRDVGMAIADLDLAEARSKTRSDRNDALLDRRPEFYSSVALRAART